MFREGMCCIFNASLIQFKWFHYKQSHALYYLISVLNCIRTSSQPITTVSLMWRVIGPLLQQLLPLQSECFCVTLKVLVLVLVTGWVRTMDHMLPLIPTVQKQAETSGIWPPSCAVFVWSQSLHSSNWAAEVPPNHWTRLSCQSWWFTPFLSSITN